MGLPAGARRAIWQAVRYTRAVQCESERVAAQRLPADEVLQSKWLYTYDPRALHSIYVKDQDVFEESEILTTYASNSLLDAYGLLTTVTDPSCSS